MPFLHRKLSFHCNDELIFFRTTNSSTGRKKGDWVTMTIKRALSSFWWMQDDSVINGRRQREHFSIRWQLSSTNFFCRNEKLTSSNCEITQQKSVGFCLNSWGGILESNSFSYPFYIDNHFEIKCLLCSFFDSWALLFTIYDNRIDKLSNQIYASISIQAADVSLKNFLCKHYWVSSLIILFV